MGRKKTSVAEDVVQLVAKLPWWSGLAIAFVGWLVFHRLAATAPAPAALQPGQIGGFLQRSIFASLANALQYLFPALCVVAACISWFGRRKREVLVQSVTRSQSADALNDMSWREFEMLVGEAFRLQGYTVAETGGSVPDGGVDLVLRKGSESFLVQCKQWKSFKVGVEVVRELYGVMAARGAAGGFVVTSGSFTDGAVAFANGRNVKLVNGTHLHGLIQQAKVSLAGKPATAVAPVRQDQVHPSGGAEPVRQCPVCNASMVRRTARKEETAGAQFWGCSRFPACRGTR